MRDLGIRNLCAERFLLFDAKLHHIPAFHFILVRDLYQRGLPAPDTRQLPSFTTQQQKTAANVFAAYTNVREQGFESRVVGGYKTPVITSYEQAVFLAEKALNEGQISYYLHVHACTMLLSDVPHLALSARYLCQILE